MSSFVILNPKAKNNPFVAADLPGLKVNGTFFCGKKTEIRRFSSREAAAELVAKDMSGKLSGCIVCPFGSVEMELALTRASE